MNGFTDSKDIRFPDTKANILLRGGMISREDLMNVKDSTIMMRNVHFGIAKRINDVTSLEVRYLDEWRSVMCGDTEKLQSIYALTPSVEDVEKYEHKTFTDKVEIAPAQKIECANEDTVKIMKDLFEDPIGPSILGDNFPPHSDDEEEAHEEEHEEEDEPTEEVEGSSEDEATEEEDHEEVEVADYTAETPSGHNPKADYDADEQHSEEDEEPEEEHSDESNTETNPTEVFVTGMTVCESIEGSGIGTITGVTTIATNSTDTIDIDTVEEPALDVSKVEAATTSTSTASTNINSQGNARRQVNINAHGKHRRR